MAYYTDTSTAPKVYLDYEPTRAEKYSIVAGTKTRTVTTTRYEFRGLTKAAADSIALAKTDTNTTAKSERMNDAGAYKVSVVEQTIGAWA
jgi:hypothetical protein